jgi:hypothetical protein
MHNAAAVFKMRPVKQRELLTWYAKQPEQILFEIHNAKIDFFRIWRSRDQSEQLDKSKIDYAALLAGINKIKKQMTTCKTSNDFELKVLAVDKLKYRKAKVADKIENDLLPLIKQLREKKLSWNQISEYIRKYHRRKISRSYLHKICSCEINKSELIE